MGLVRVEGWPHFNNVPFPQRTDRSGGSYLTPTAGVPNCHLEIKMPNIVKVMTVFGTALLRPTPHTLAVLPAHCKLLADDLGEITESVFSWPIRPPGSTKLKTVGLPAIPCSGNLEVSRGRESANKNESRADLSGGTGVTGIEDPTNPSHTREWAQHFHVEIQYRGQRRDFRRGNASEVVLPETTAVWAPQLDPMVFRFARGRRPGGANDG